MTKRFKIVCNYKRVGVFCNIKDCSPQRRGERKEKILLNFIDFNAYYRIFAI